MTVTPSRRTFLKLCGVAAATPLLPACGGNEPAPPLDAGTFVVPPLLEGELSAGVRVFRLELQEGEVEWVPGAPTQTYGANGDVLGPTLHLRRGERARIEVTNGLPEVSTLHWHGMEVPASADGGPYQTIAPGTTWSAEFDVVQRALTAWYHPHQMHETARQVYMGIAGFIVVDDPATGLASTYGVDDFPVVIQDRALFADGTHPYSPGNAPSMHQMMSGVRGSVMLVNGVVTPRAVVPRRLVRLRVLNGSNARVYNLGFSDDRPFLHIASDGGLLEAPLSTTRVLLAPGERAELLVDMGDQTGAEVGLRSYSGEVFSQLYNGMMGANLTDTLDRSTFDVMSFTVGDDTSALVAPASFSPIERIDPASAVRTRPMTFAMSAGEFTINGTTMTEIGASVPSAINFRIAAGATEIWEVTNNTGIMHPLHLHNHHFQVLDIDGTPPAAAIAGWKDTTIIAPGKTVRLIIPFTGAPDAELPYMFHCHLLEHEDMGMMGQFYLV